MKSAPQLILALDVDTHKKAIQWVKRLYPKVKIFKVGLQLYTACGPKIVADIKRLGAKVFLDLKLNDIPNTTASAVKEILKQKVDFFTVHTLAGQEALKEVARVCRGSSAKSLGVTLLTSIGQRFLRDLAIQRKIKEEVMYLARMAKRCGLNGVVCSVEEAKSVRKLLGRNFLIVTPGIRPKGFSRADQKRVATAEDAAKAGVDYIVVGRQILEAKEPLAVIRDLTEHGF